MAATRAAETGAHRLRGALESYTTADGRVITLVPISTQAEARRMLVRWLWLFRLVRIVQHLDAVAGAEGLAAARRAGRQLGAFVD